VRPTSRQPRHQQSRASQVHCKRLGVPEESIPQKGLSAIPLVEAIHEGKIKGLISICFNPAVSLPMAITFARRLENWSSTSTSISSSPRPLAMRTLCLQAH